jgi:hypothetical protein
VPGERGEMATKTGIRILHSRACNSDGLADSLSLA